MKRFFTRQPAGPRTDTTPAGERQADGGAKPDAIQRRRFTRALLVSVPVAAAAVAATAWTQSLTCPELTDATFDALRTFRVTYVDKGPEAGIPPNN